MITLMLTATVEPHVFYESGAGPSHSLSDASARLLQYLDALRWWRLNRPSGWRILVGENSGQARLLECVGPEIDVIDVPPPSPLVARKGKGAMETDLMVKMLHEVDPGGMVVKCTGRLIVPNIAKLQIADDDSVRARRNVTATMVDTRLLAAPVAVWDRMLVAAMPTLNDANGAWLERTLAPLIRIEELNGVVVRSFPRAPVLVGVSGQSGRAYRNRRNWLLDRVNKRSSAIALAAMSKVWY